MNIDRIKQNLLDADCNANMIQQFISLVNEGDVKEQLKWLTCHRCRLLHDVHEKSKKVDCIDYLIYQLKKQEKEREGVTYEKSTNHS